MGAEDLVWQRQRDMLRKAAPGTLGGRVPSPGRLAIRKPQLEKMGASSGGAGLEVYIPAARASDGTSTVSLSVGWNIVQVTAAWAAAIVWRTEAYLSIADRFSIAFFHGEPLVADLPADPYASGAWTPRPPGWVIHWGQYNEERVAEEAAGYSVEWGEGFETDGATVNGDFKEDAAWVYNEADDLWAAVYVETACTFWAKLTKGPGLA